jgi:carbamoyltransferase
MLDELARLGVRPRQMVREDHHFAHACAARMACTVPDAVIMTCDGYGDGLSFTIRRSTAGRVPEHADVTAPIDASLGLIYQYVTGALGYSMLSEEWKVLGIEPYGEPAAAEELFGDLFEPDGGDGIGPWSGKKLAAWAHPGPSWELLDPAQRRDALRRYLELAVPRFDRRDVASAVQDLIEQRIVNELQRLGPSPGTSLALAGGTFLNVRLNRVLGEIDWIADVNVFPAAGDGGNSVGAALAYLHRTSARPPRPGIRDVYWGPSYTDTGSADVAPDEAQVIERLASAVADGRIVGLYRGRSEFGPRALLNRSLICRADEPALTALLNERLRRDPIMPYGCSMLASEARSALIDADPIAQCLRFMTGAAYVTDAFGSRFRPVCHPVRGGGMSTRPHIVPDDDSWAATLLRAIRDRTGAAVVLNTSFNLHGEPIVETPSDALASFRAAALPNSLLLIGDRVIELAPAATGPIRPYVHEPPRRRAEAVAVVVDPAAADDVADIARLGLAIAAERPTDDGRRAILVVGSESPGHVGAWANRVCERDHVTVTLPATQVAANHLLLTHFRDTVGRRAGNFADLLLRPGALSVADATDVLARTSSLALAGLLHSPPHLLSDHADSTTVGGGPAVVHGISIVAPSGGRVLAYAPLGLADLVRLVRELGSLLEAGKFRQCREAGLVLAYAPPTGERAELESAVAQALAWHVDALVAVSPALDASTARVVEDLADRNDLAVIGGSDCDVAERHERPLGVQSIRLGRFINRFPGIEL